MGPGSAVASAYSSVDHSQWCDIGPHLEKSSFLHPESDEHVALPDNAATVTEMPGAGDTG